MRGGYDKVLLHCCCAPCSGEVLEAMPASSIDYNIFFCNPTIHPFKEYELRKNENIRFADQFGVPFIDADYDQDNWFERAWRIEHERGHYQQRFKTDTPPSPRARFSLFHSLLRQLCWHDCP